MLKYHWPRIAIFSGIGLGLAGIVTVLMPKKYEAQIQILLDQKPPVMPSAMTTAQQSVSDFTDFARPRSIATQVDQLTSAEVLSTAGNTVADRFGIRLDADSELSPINLQRAVTVQAAETSDIVGIRVRLSTPQLAEAVAAEIYNAFFQQNARNARESAEQAIAALKSQIQVISNRLQTIDRDIAVSKKGLNVPDVAMALQVQSSGLQQLQLAYDQAKADYEAARSRAAAVKAQLVGVPHTILTQSVQAQNPNYVQANDQLLVAQADYSTALSQYTPNSPFVKQAKAKLDSLVKQQKRIQANLNQSTVTAINPTYQSLSLDYAQASSLAQSLGSRVQQLKAQLDARQREVDQLPEAQVKLAALTREQDVLSRSYQTYIDQLAPLEAANRARSTNSRVVSPAYAAPLPASPRVPLNLALGLLGGLFLGIASAFAQENKRGLIRTGSKLLQLAPLPIYRIVPSLPSPLRTTAPDVADAYGGLLAGFLYDSKRPYHLAFVPSGPRAGSTTAVVNVLRIATNRGFKVAVVMTDEAPASGRKEIRPANRALAEAIAASKATVLKLDPATVSGSFESLEATITEQIADADLVLYDLDSPQASTAYASFARLADEFLVFVRPNVTTEPQYALTVQALNAVDAKKIHVVMTDVKEPAALIASSDVPGSESLPLVYEDAA